jgi:hypothetical protein
MSLNDTKSIQTKDHNSSKNVRMKKNLVFTIIYTSCLIIYASLKEIRLIVNEKLMPQDFITEINKGP